MTPSKVTRDQTKAMLAGNTCIRPAKLIFGTKGSFVAAKSMAIPVLTFDPIQGHIVTVS